MARRVISLLLAALLALTLWVPALASEEPAADEPMTAPDEPWIPEQSPMPEESPAPEESPKPTGSPAPEESPDPEETPDPEQSPTPEETPAPEQSPDPEESPKPEQSPAPENPFKDVKETAWYYDAVMQAYLADIVRGITEDTFSPGGTATRGQTVTMLHRMAGAPATSAVTKFGDLTADYYKDAVAWAWSEGIVTGRTETQFDPEGKITREQLAAMLHRWAGEPDLSGIVGILDDFSDAGSIHDYARKAMMWAVHAGIITGYADGTLRPTGAATRAEVCAMLMRARALD